MTDAAERAIEQEFTSTDNPIASFNILIETMTTAALANGMDRKTLLSLVIQQATAQAGAGRSAARGRQGSEAMIYKTIQDSTMAARTGVDALRQTR